MLICFFILDKNIAFATEIDGSDPSAQMYPLSERIISNDEPIYDEYGYMLGHSPEPDSTTHDTTDVYSTNNSEEPYSPRTLLPNSVDLSDDIYFPPVGNQNNTGSCVSWATTYYQFTYQVARMNMELIPLNFSYSENIRRGIPFLNGQTV